MTIIALAGNPNAGKTTLFNELTGAHQHVGNYPGVTVEKKTGHYRIGNVTYDIVDLPGTYSLTAYSLEELVARNFLVNEKPAVVVDIVDAANLERNLYLAIQFMEMGVPVVIALNMMDVAQKRGIHIDTHKLEELLGVHVEPIVARRGHGVPELMETVFQVAGRKSRVTTLKISYGEDMDLALKEMTAEIKSAGFLVDRYRPEWIALKYLERDYQVLDLGQKHNPTVAQQLSAKAAQLCRHIQKTTGADPEAIVADQRYGFIKSILNQGVSTTQYDHQRLYMSDKIDLVLTNRLVGPLLMVAVIYGLYYFTFTYSEIPIGWLEGLFGWLGGLAEAYLPHGLLKSMIIAGVIDGVGGVLGFVPLIMFMFFGIAMLEDSGYLARVAYMLDRVFTLFGLHGSSVMPFIVSGGIAGGCAVPGVMATRTLKSPKERLATLLTAPFMNCGAKLPIFALLVAAFFADHEAEVMFLLTAVSWLGALIVAKFLRITAVKGESTPFVMELPPYRLPTVKGILIHTWERTWQYIKKAGTVILGISVILWAMMTFPHLSEEKAAVFQKERQALLATAPARVTREIEPDNRAAELSEEARALQDQINTVSGREAEASLRYSIAGRMGAALEPFSRFAGFDWRTNIALVGGFAAKEVVVSTLGTAYSLGEVDPDASRPLADKLVAAPGWRPLTAMALIIFIIFYAPCFVAVVCIGKEAGSWKWGAFSMVFNTALAFGLAVLVYQVGSLLGF